MCGHFRVVAFHYKDFSEMFNIFHGEIKKNESTSRLSVSGDLKTVKYYFFITIVV